MTSISQAMLPPSKSSPAGRALRLIFGITATCLLLLAFYYPHLAEDLPRILDPYVYSEDTRQHVWPLWHYYDDQLFREDFIRAYYLALMPDGYELAYREVFSFLAPMVFSKSVGYGLYVLTLVVVALCSYRLAGLGAALATTALFVSGGFLLALTAGGFPRSFSPLILAVAALALIEKRPLWIAIVTVVSATIYPTAAALCGAVLALYCLAWGRIGDLLGIPPAWPLWQRAVLLFATGAITVAALLPTTLDLRPYGERLSPDDVAEVQAYPEILGRHPLAFERGYTLASFVKTTPIYATRTFLGDSERPLNAHLRAWGHDNRRLVLLFVAVVTLAGLALGLWRDAALRRLMILPLASAGMAAAAMIAYPLLYYPQRFVMFSIPILAVILFPVALSALAHRLSGARALQGKGALVRGLVVGFGTAIVLFTLGGLGSPTKGLLDAEAKNGELFDAIAELPPDTMVAGWPKGVVADVPVIARRRILISHEVHLAFHEAYVKEMRDRMNALIDAYFGVTTDAAQALQANYGVTHLLIDRQLLRAERAPAYFPPFDRKITTAFEHMKQSGSALLSADGRAHIFDDGRYLLLDLGILLDDASAAPEQ